MDDIALMYGQHKRSLSPGLWVFVFELWKKFTKRIKKIYDFLVGELGEIWGNKCLFLSVSCPFSSWWRPLPSEVIVSPGLRWSQVGYKDNVSPHFLCMKINALSLKEIIIWQIKCSIPARSENSAEKAPAPAAGPCCDFGSVGTKGGKVLYMGKRKDPA